MSNIGVTKQWIPQTTAIAMAALSSQFLDWGGEKDAADDWVLIVIF